MAKIYRGMFVPQFRARTVIVETGIKGERAGRTREMLDAYTQVTVVAQVSDKPADLEKGTKRAVTIQVAVAGPNQLRRMTGFQGFDEKDGESIADKLKTLNPGDVITTFGRPMYSGGQGTASNGHEVVELHMIEKAPVEQAAEPETLPEVENAMIESN